MLILHSPCDRWSLECGAVHSYASAMVRHPPQKASVTLADLPHAAFRIALAHAAAGEPLPAAMRAIWPVGVPLPEEIEFVELQPAPLTLPALGEPVPVAPASAQD